MMETCENGYSAITFDFCMTWGCPLRELELKF